MASLTACPAKTSRWSALTITSEWLFYQACVLYNTVRCHYCVAYYEIQRLSLQLNRRQLASRKIKQIRTILSRILSRSHLMLRISHLLCFEAQSVFCGTNSSALRSNVEAMAATVNDMIGVSLCTSQSLDDMQVVTHTSTFSPSGSQVGAHVLSVLCLCSTRYMYCIIYTRNNAVLYKHCMCRSYILATYV